jgi:putative sigma-54 modulation protein
LDIIVKTKCEVPARVKKEAVERVEHATRFFGRLRSVEMVFDSEHNTRIPEPAVVEVTARTKGHHIRAEGWAADHRAAVDIAVGKFERQLARYKARMIDRSRRRGTRGSTPAAVRTQLSEPAAPSEPHPSWPQPRIVRTKRFELAPMLPDEAAVQLELLGHEFFVFTNAATGRCSVVYRRRDGELGLIETEPRNGSQVEDQP